jgi:hypothetical protein
MLTNLIYRGVLAADVATFVVASMSRGSYDSGAITTTLVGALGFVPLAWYVSDRWIACGAPDIDQS